MSTSTIAQGNRNAMTDTPQVGAKLRTISLEAHFASPGLSSGRPIMKKFGMLGIIGGAALLTVAPFSLQWPQDEASLSRANARTSIAGVHRRIYRRTYRRPAYAAAAAGVAGYGYGSYYGHSSPYYSSYYTPRPYSSYYAVISYAPTYPPHRYSYYLPPFASVSSYDTPPPR